MSSINSDNPSVGWEFDHARNDANLGPASRSMTYLAKCWTQTSSVVMPVVTRVASPLSQGNGCCYG